MADFHIMVPIFRDICSEIHHDLVCLIVTSVLKLSNRSMPNNLLPKIQQFSGGGESIHDFSNEFNLRNQYYGILNNHLQILRCNHENRS